MIALDTNVLARFLYHGDDPEQSRRATALIRDASARGETFFVPDIVLCELVWVFEQVFRLSRPDIAHRFDGLLNTNQLVFESRDRLQRILDAYRHGKGDFADYLIRDKAQQRGCEAVATFDRALRRDSGFQVL